MSAHVEIDCLRSMLTRPDKQHIRPIILRRLYALEQSVDYWSTFDPVSDCLFRLWCDAKPFDGPGYATPALEEIDDPTAYMVM